MKKSNDEAFEEIIKRGREIKRQRERRVSQVLYAAAFLLLFGILGVVGAVSGTGSAETAGASYGSLLLSAEYGVFVLIGVLAFALGVTVTILIQRKKKRQEDNVSEPDGKSGGEQG